MIARRYLVYDAETEQQIGEVSSAVYEKYVQDARQAPGLRAFNGDRFGFPGHKVYIPEAEHELAAVYRRWSYEAAIIILGHETTCIRPPTYNRGFVGQLRLRVPKVVWCDGKTTELRKGWWMPGHPLNEVLPLLQRYFPGKSLEVYREDGIHLKTIQLGTVEAKPPPPPLHDSPPEDCEPMHVWLSVDDIRELVDTGQTRLYRAITPFPEDHDNLDTSDAQFWTTGLGFDVADAYGRPGERRWLNEIFAIHESGRVAYRADYRDGPPGGGSWQKRTLMKREEARLVAEVGSITAHRLHDLLASDFGGNRTELARRWDERKSGEDYPFSTNPWVWRIELRRFLPRNPQV